MLLVGIIIGGVCMAVLNYEASRGKDKYIERLIKQNRELRER